MKVRLKELAARAEIKSLVNLGAEVGMSPQTIYLFANNKGTSIRLDVLEKLCDRLNCKPGDLLDHTPKGGA